MPKNCPLGKKDSHACWECIFYSRADKKCTCEPKEVIEEKQRVIDLSFDHMVATLKDTRFPIMSGDATVGEAKIDSKIIHSISSKLIDEGYRLPQYSEWVFDNGNLVCNNCHGKALTSPDAFGEIILSRYCPHCGSNMKG